MHQQHGQRRALRYDRRPCRTLYAPVEYEYEQRVQHHAHAYGRKHHGHRLDGVARGAQLLVQTQVEVRYYVSGHDDAHEVAGVCYGLLRGLVAREEVEYRVEEPEHYAHDRESEQEVEQYGVAEYLFGRAAVALAQTDRYARCGADADHGAEGRGDVHYGQRDCHARYGRAAYAVSYEDAVYDIVQRRRRHGDNGRYGILGQQPTKRIGTQRDCIVMRIFTHQGTKLLIKN